MVDTGKCPYCNGAGGWTDGEDFPAGTIVCPECKGSGKIPGYPYDANKGWERLQRALEEEGDK